MNAWDTNKALLRRKSVAIRGITKKTEGKCGGAREMGELGCVCVCVFGLNKL